MRFLASIFGYVLNFIYGVVNNYGIAIIIFTILLKAIMLPISIKQQKTMKKSAKVQVKVKEIQEKYKNDQVRQSQEMMDLYKKENMSPFSGCLTSIVQIVIILSVFYVVSSPLTYMKHLDSELINTYTTKLTESSDSEIRYKEIAIIKEFSEEDENVRLNMDFLGLDLSDVPTQSYQNWKVFVIPALYVITSIISTKLTMSMNKKKDNKDEIKENITKEEKDDKEDLQAIEDMNKQMTYMMPIMSFMIALIAPLGLALYWLVSNILMIIERLVLNKFFKEKEEEE